MRRALRHSIVFFLKAISAESRKALSEEMPGRENQIQTKHKEHFGSRKIDKGSRPKKNVLIDPFLLDIIKFAFFREQ